MNIQKQLDPLKTPRSRVELHLHLDGSIRLETIWEIAQKKNFDLGSPSIDDLRRRLQTFDSPSLKNFLGRFDIYMPAFVGDLEAIERIAYELCEDQARDAVAYFETRFSPHLFASEEKNVTPGLVIQAVSRGLERGQADFNIKARSILCAVLSRDDWPMECVKLCEEYAHAGVVGIDIAKDETDEKGYTKSEVEAFQRARQLGIPRTAHAGESGDYSSVRDAMVELDCSRVGHGYRVFQDTTGNTYKMAQDRDLHFEVCPYSSILTGACPLDSNKHAIVKFAEDDINFSVSKDDTTITGTTLFDEYGLLVRLGLTEAHLARANLNGARSCFLPPGEKKDLLEELYREYGVSKKAPKRPLNKQPWRARGQMNMIAAHQLPAPGTRGYLCLNQQASCIMLIVLDSKSKEPNTALYFARQQF
ncbi:adenosine deaminase-like [Haemaphysalis longicornis]